MGKVTETADAAKRVKVRLERDGEGSRRLIRVGRRVGGRVDGTRL